jgi:predicted nucleic acid-binding protein
VKIFLDANILFTAAYSPKGKSALLISQSKTLSLELVTCDFAIEEAKKNLLIKAPRSLNLFDEILLKIGSVPTVFLQECPIDLPLKDHPIFLSALKSECSHLLTGDMKDFGKHMGKPKKTGGIMIQTVTDFIQSL